MNSIAHGNMSLTHGKRDSLVLLPGLIACLILLAPLPAMAINDCIVADNGGTADLPAAGCDYLGDSDVDMYVISGNLPPGTTIEMVPIHNGFACVDSTSYCSAAIPMGVCEAAGGSLAGDVSCAESNLQLQATGTGALAGFSRILNVPIEWESHSGPRTPGDPIQSFTTEMSSMLGQLFGDTDFCVFNLRAGSVFGLPSPGQTTLTQLGTTEWNVESFFDIAYEIDFQGCPGSALEGFGGTSVGALKIRTGDLPGLCEVPDIGGTAELPPDGCDYLGETVADRYVISGNLPPGSTIEMIPIHGGFTCVDSAFFCSVPIAMGVCETPGGSLAGAVSCAQANIEMEVSGTGALASFSRILSIPSVWESHSAPRTAGDPYQFFVTEMHRMQGQLLGDPDFCLLNLRAGSILGLPSPGQTALIELPTTDWNVDSFFDINYEIDFEGCPGSIIEGFGGTSTGMLTILTGKFPAPEPGQIPMLIVGTTLLALLARRSAAQSAFTSTHLHVEVDRTDEISRID